MTTTEKPRRKPPARASKLVMDGGAVGLSFTVKRIPRRWWKGTHMSSWALFWTGIVHGATAGTDASQPLYIATTGAMILLVLFLTMTRALSARKRRRKAPMPAPASALAAPVA